MAFHNHGVAWQSDDGVTVCDYDGYRRTEKSTRTEAHIKCLQKVPDDMARMAGGEVHIRTCEPSIACVCIACHEYDCASRAEFVSDCWSKQHMYSSR